MSFFTLSLSIKADPWTSFSGSKARGMGTAFVAIANDPSAAWLNPAGLYQMQGLNVSLETGNAPKYQQHPNSTYSVYEYNGNPIDLDPVEANPNVPQFNRFQLYDAWNNSKTRQWLTSAHYVKPFHPLLSWVAFIVFLPCKKTKP
jgi:hypothetical protein